MDILYQSWLVFTWYLVLQNILLDLLCLFIFINFHSLLKGFLPLSSLSCGHPKIETNIWKGNCQGVCLSGPDFWFWGDLFRGFWGQQKIPRTLRYLISFWMQFTHSTLYLIYLIQTGPPWNTYHKKKKKAGTTIDLQFWSDDQAVKIHITWCLLHICHMWYFLIIICMYRHFPNVDLSKGSPENSHRLVVFESEKVPPIFIACPGEERMALWVRRAQKYPGFGPTAF